MLLGGLRFWILSLIVSVIDAQDVNATAVIGDLSLCGVCRSPGSEQTDSFSKLASHSPFHIVGVTLANSIVFAAVSAP